MNSAALKSLREKPESVLDNQIILGITGGIGAGKSTVCEVLREFGVPVYEADTRAKELMTENQELSNAIKDLFGPSSFENGRLNRAFIASEAFNDKQKLEKLNRLVHPAVAEDFQQWLSKHDVEIVAKEAALLVEAGSYKELDKLVVVAADEEVRIERVLKRDPHRGEDQIRDIISNQLPQADKVNLADFVIRNNPDDAIIPQVEKMMAIMKQG